MMKFTFEQQQAIDYDLTKPLLVSAAAGSGKTAVLINRIYERLISKKVEPENLLVMTFTNKAALQMRQKLELKLAEKMDTTSDPILLQRLREIKKRLPMARISTIHAFCLSIIKEYNAYLLDENDELILDININNMSETQEAIYLARAIDDVLNFIYQNLADLKNEDHDSDQIISQSLPGISQKEISLFNIMTEPIHKKDWLSDFEKLSFAFTEKYTDQTMRDRIIGMLHQFKSLPYYEDAVISAFNNYQAKSKNISTSKFVDEVLKQLAEVLDQAIFSISKAKTTNYYSDVFKGKINTKEVYNLNSRLDIEEKVLQEISLILKSKKTNQEKWHAVFLAAKNLDAPIVLRANNRDTKAAIEKREFMSIYEPNVLPAIIFLNSEFKPDTTVLVRNNIKYVPPYFIQDLPDYEKSLQKMIRPLARFIEIIILSDRRFQQIKRRHNLIDFNDYEHFALKLLDQKDVAAAIHAQYQEVYIDEFQDTNPIQEMIVNRIKSDKVFMVGDLKQSIYRFRNADPSIFKNKLKKYQDYNQNTIIKTMPNVEQDSSSDLSDGYYILLNKNFRSAETLLMGINQLFEWFMHEEVAEIEYDEKQKLIPGNNNLLETKVGKKKINFYAVQIPVEEKKQTKDKNQSATTENEEIKTKEESNISNPKIIEERLKAIAPLNNIELQSNTDINILLEALNVVQIIENEIYAGANYEDFAILARTKKICGIYSQVLKAFNIPVNGKEEKNSLDSLELRFLIQLINLLDNAKQDIPLVAIMRSNIFNLAFNEDELLICKLINPQTKYFHEILNSINQMTKEEFVGQINTKLIDYPQNDLENIYNKVIQFKQIISELREKANWLSLSELLDEIFQIADYPDQLSQLPFSDQRLADIEKFQEWANQFEQEKGSGLHDFTNYIQKIKEKKLLVEDFDEAPIASNSVSIMTIHASKGLEYKHVILAGSNKEIKNQDKSFLFHFDPDFGFASYTADTDEQIIYSNTNLIEFQEIEKKKLWSEEYRLLYVAMTRAEEQLTILANIQEEKRNQILLDLIPDLIQEIKPQNLYKLNTYAEIIMSFLVKQAKAENINTNLLDYFTFESLPESGELQQSLENYEINLITADKLIDQFEAMQIKRAERQLSDDEDQEILKEISNKQEKAKQSLLAIDLKDEQSKQQISRIENLLTEIEDPFIDTPAKITVTELKNKAETESEIFEKDILPKGMADMGYVLRKPDLLKQNKKFYKSGVEFGTFIHELMHFIYLQDYDQKPKELWQQIYDAQILQLIEKKKIKPHEKEMADYAYPYIEKFLLSDLAERILKAEKQENLVYREIPFTLSIPPIMTNLNESNHNNNTQIKNDNFDSSDQTLLQGMIDLWFMEGDQAILIDYKSDYIQSEDKLSILKERYDVQLKYYALAIERILELKNRVKEKYIWLLREGKAYKL